MATLLCPEVGGPQNGGDPLGVPLKLQGVPSQRTRPEVDFVAR